MTQEILIGLLVGGAIGFLFSILGSIVASYLQRLRDKEARTWEDKKLLKEQNHGLVTNRLDTLETEMDKYFLNLTKALNALQELFSYENNSIELRNFKKEYYWPIVQNSSRLLAKAWYFSDDELSFLMNKNLDLGVEVVTGYDSLVTATQAHDENLIKEIRQKALDLSYVISSESADFYVLLDNLRAKSDLVFEEVSEKGIAIKVKRELQEHRKKINSE